MTDPDKLDGVELDRAIAEEVMGCVHLPTRSTHPGLWQFPDGSNTLTIPKYSTDPAALAELKRKLIEDPGVMGWRLGYNKFVNTLPVSARIMSHHDFCASAETECLALCRAALRWKRGTK